MMVKIDNQNNTTYNTTLNYFDNLTVKCESEYEGSLEWFKSTSMTKIKVDNGSTGVSQWRWQYRDRDRDSDTLVLFTRLVIRKATEIIAGKYFCKKTDRLNKKKAVEIEIEVTGKSLFITFSPGTYRFNNDNDNYRALENTCITNLYAPILLKQCNSVTLCIYISYKSLVYFREQ